MDQDQDQAIIRLTVSKTEGTVEFFADLDGENRSITVDVNSPEGQAFLAAAARLSLVAIIAATTQEKASD
jgi:hypothetical protein